MKRLIRCLVMSVVVFLSLYLVTNSIWAQEETAKEDIFIQGNNQGVDTKGLQVLVSGDPSSVAQVVYISPEGNTSSMTYTLPISVTYPYTVSQEDHFYTILVLLPGGKVVSTTWNTYELCDIKTKSFHLRPEPGRIMLEGANFSKYDFLWSESPTFEHLGWRPLPKGTILRDFVSEKAVGTFRINRQVSPIEGRSCLVAKWDLYLARSYLPLMVR